jgi:GNAT superfamily N-acetyltransferase
VDDDLLTPAAALLASEWGGEAEVFRAHLDWKYLRNPYLPEPLAQVAVSGGEVVGVHGAMGTCWEAAGRRLIVPHGGDFVVAPAFRRMGISRLLLNAYRDWSTARGFPFVVSFSTNPAGTRSSLSVGWQEVAAFPSLAVGGAGLGATGRRLTAATLTWLDGYRLGADLHRRGRHLAASRRRDPFATLDDMSAGELLVGPRFPQERLLPDAAPRASRVISHVRDAAYFDWRLDDPLSDFRVATLPGAYVVLGCHRSGGPVRLVDWRFADPEAFSLLVGLVLRCVGRVRLWQTSLDDRTAGILRRAGRVAAAEGPPETFVIGLLTDAIGELWPGGPAITDPQSWNVRMLDSDIV